MRNGISLWLLAVMPFSITLNTSCASLALHSPPQLQNRTLRLSPDIAGFEYQWEECVRKFIGICTKHEMKKEFYDLNDVEVRKKLINMGFVAKVRSSGPQ